MGFTGPPIFKKPKENGTGFTEHIKKKGRGTGFTAKKERKGGQFCDFRIVDGYFEHGVMSSRSCGLEISV